MVKNKSAQPNSAFAKAQMTLPENQEANDSVTLSAASSSSASSSSSSSTSPSEPASLESKGEHHESLARHDAIFTSLLHLIPPQFYLIQDHLEDGQDIMSSKYLKNKRKKPKSEKEAMERKQNIREAKKQKLDPDNFKTVTDIQVERQAQRASQQMVDDNDSDIDIDASGLVDSDHDDDEAAGDTDSDVVDSDMEDINIVPSQHPQSLVPSQQPVQTEGQRKASIEALRAKLHAKIANLQKQRQPPSDTSKDALLEERRRKRSELKAAKKSPRSSSATAGAASSSSNTTNPSFATKPPALLVGSHGESSSSFSSDSKGASNLHFSSIQFSSEPDKKKKDRLSLPSNPKAALQALQSRNQKLSQLQQKIVQTAADDSEASQKLSELGQKQSWDRAIAAASGVKLRNDEKLLEKAIKRKDQQKDKSSKAWNERIQEEKDQQASRQKKRTENLAARKAGKKKKTGSSSSSSAKGKKKVQAVAAAASAASKGKGKGGRPGFEGKGKGGESGFDGKGKGRAGFEGKSSRKK